ncbi:caffeoylshikimate esterase-like [Impatiens glandulifera]|uniref:caffeoylshikimate esterase-like n=1 Tax=Impatiens glandulifera TaxID=253017 RepID=UPI001FB0FF63|nr:caffeoylshikimate esterase-like [Impatiens glandulifera]
MILLHPIHLANEKSLFGGISKEEFYKKHQIIHNETFILNKHGKKIFTQTWSPDPTISTTRALVAMIHGYTDESSWFMQLTAVALAQAGFHTVALDLQGHGFSEGHQGHVPDIGPLVEDCREVFNSARLAQPPNLPAFLYGESLGGAIAILTCIDKLGCHHYRDWDGMVICGAMCGVSKKLRPPRPVEMLLPLAAFMAPKWNIIITKPPASKSYKERWKKLLVKRRPNKPKNEKPTAASALELLKVCDYISGNGRRIEVPLLMIHGGDDKICEPESARVVYESASSKDKTLRIFEGMWHQFIGESNDRVEEVFGVILAWIVERVDRLTRQDDEVKV